MMNRKIKQVDAEWEKIAKRTDICQSDSWAYDKRLNAILGKPLSDAERESRQKHFWIIACLRFLEERYPKDAAKWQKLLLEIIENQQEPQSSMLPPGRKASRAPGGFTLMRHITKQAHVFTSGNLGYIMPVVRRVVIPQHWG